MKTTTAIEFLREKRTKQELAFMTELKDLIIFSSEGAIGESSFTIGNSEETDMLIKIRDVFFDIDGINWIDWLHKNCKVSNESDKWITINSLK